MDHFTDIRRRNILGLSGETLTDKELSTMFLDNLKTATPWIEKRVNILL